MQAIDALLKAMKGGAEAGQQRGTLLNYLAALAADGPGGKSIIIGMFKQL